MNYLIQAGETDDPEAFVRKLAQKVPQHEEALMTIALQLEQKGIEKGIQLGEQKGLEKGLLLEEQKVRLDIAVKLLESGKSLKFVKEMTGLSEEELAKISTEQPAHSSREHARNW